MKRGNPNEAIRSLPCPACGHPQRWEYKKPSVRCSCGARLEVRLSQRGTVHEYWEWIVSAPNAVTKRGWKDPDQMVIPGTLDRKP